MKTSSKKLKTLIEELNYIANELDSRLSSTKSDLLLPFSSFQSKLDEEIERSNRYNVSFSICMITLDSIPFEENEKPAPDKIFHLLASQIQAINRPADLISLYEKEALMLLLPMTSKMQAKVLTERLCSEIANLWKINCLNVKYGPLISKEELQYLIGEEEIIAKKNQKPYLTVSVGVATYPEDSVEKANLIKLTLKLVNSAMEKGGNRVEIEKSKYAFLPNLPPVVETLLTVETLLISLNASGKIKREIKSILTLRKKFQTILERSDDNPFCRSFLTDPEYVIFEKLVKEWLKQYRRESKDRRQNPLTINEEKRRKSRRKEKKLGGQA